MEIVGVHHVQITIPQGSEKQAKQFYCSLLGLREIEKPETLKGRGGFWLQVGDRQVHVGTEQEVERERTKAHVAYEVKGLLAWRERLEAEGYTILDGVPIAGFERFEMRDPFGNRIELIEAVESEG
jgi:catechol 2,3-dioxygenase-like lactoylglutathione lyase family enzyme